MNRKEYITLRTFPDIPNQKGTSGSTALVTGDGYGMSASLEGEKAEAAWKWIWFFCGPVGSKIRQAKGMITAYNLPVNEELDIMIKKLAGFISETPGGYVLDGVMDAEGMGVLQQGVQEMMLGAKTPEQVAAEYEAWVAANDSNRKKITSDDTGAGAKNFFAPEFFEALSETGINVTQHNLKKWSYVVLIAPGLLLYGG
jgi:raffinose/stachyose/melibiose transport system substrate-binding protein